MKSVHELINIFWVEIEQSPKVVFVMSGDVLVKSVNLLKCNMWEILDLE